MAWQDDLRRLDEELAAGRLSTDDYRRRRDELIAQVAATQDNVTSQNSSVNQPPGPQVSPFPPAFRWEPVPSETTQVINPVNSAAAESSDETQVVRNPEQPSSAPPHDFESTQVIQAGPPPPPMPEQPPYQPTGGYSGSSDPEPGWAQQESAPPWLSSDLSPMEESSAGWTVQGPEFFEAENNKEPGPQRIVAIVAAVVVLAGIAFGAWFLWSRDVSTVAEPVQPSQQQEPAVTPTTPEPEPEDPLAPADVGGSKELKDVDSFADLEAVNFLTTAELDVLEAAGAGESRLLITNFEEGKATILVSEASSTKLAATGRDALTSLQLSYGFVSRAAPPGVNSVELAKTNATPTLRALYVSGALIIRIEMRADDQNGRISNSEARQLAAKFAEIIARQLEKLPADA